MAYRPTDPKSRWKAMLAALAVTSGMGAVIITGLNVEMVGKAIERLETFDIRIPPAPPPPPPPPPPEQRAQDVQGAPAAPEASPVVAPEPVVRIPTEQPVAAAPEPGAGAGAMAGQGGAGTGTGAGGTGTGAGAGAGAGSGAGFTPAQRIRRIPDAEYRRLVRISGMRQGSVGVRVRVEPDGSPSNCRVVRSSGNSSADSLMCELTERHVRFRPARDPQGRPIAQDVTWYPDWSPR